ncbi:MAG TPA: sn-glycerol-3-phosphate ABC transporter ATP-binding protein UgpC [Thermomicrobiales bacterium]|nr:sn-glycerol-3-phosphate ABC transporter ATP-binding protein UgpC [Thermomicrobiales bacterium]
MSTVVCRNLTKVFGQAYAVRELNLEIGDGEFVVLVGPSGCGKTTTLRMIAGLERVSSGEIYLNGKLINQTPPRHRDIAVVFQNYALYPHKTVAGNLSYALKLRKTSKSEIETRVQRTADILGIGHLLDRMPHQLSGGQRQRVALGRAIVREPQLFLMDEPLSNLDAKLRLQTRGEIVRLQRRLGVTTVYVTHDQIEAMTMGDRIVVMHDGVVQQMGTPAQLYNHPANLFVAGFLGSPSMNFFDAELTTQDGSPAVQATFGRITLPPESITAVVRAAGDERQLICGIRPEDVALAAGSPSSNGDGAADPALTVDLVELVGSDSYVSLAYGGGLLQARVPADQAWREGQHVRLVLNPRKLRFFSKLTGVSLTDDVLTS